MKKIALLALVLFFAACVKTNNVKYNYVVATEPQKTCYEIADRLARQLYAKNVSNVKILKTSFVNIDNIESVSSTGRAYSEFISSRLCQLGFTVVELKMRESSVKVTPQGELILSNDQAELAKKYDASAAIIGYYQTINNRDVALFARIININDNTLLASDDVSTW